VSITQLASLMRQSCHRCGAGNVPTVNSRDVIHMNMMLGANGASEDFLMKCDSLLTETSLLYLNEQKYRSSQIREKKLLLFIHIWLLHKFLPKVKLPKLFYLVATLIYLIKSAFLLVIPYITIVI